MVSFTLHLHILARNFYFPLTRCAIFISPGHETFSGRCLHSWEYKDADACRGKRVVVVGIGNSGGDIAAEISRSAEKVRQKKRKAILQNIFNVFHFFCALVRMTPIEYMSNVFTPSPLTLSDRHFSAHEMGPG